MSESNEGIQKSVVEIHSVIRSKLHRPIFAFFVQNKIPLSFVSFLFLWSEMICTVFFRKFIPLFGVVLIYDLFPRVFHVMSLVRHCLQECYQ